MSARETLVAGVGNILHGDDGFGVEVARRLLSRGPLPGARVVELGTRGHDLAYALAAADTAVLIDAAQKGGRPGTLYVIEPRESGGLPPKPEHGHSLDVMKALELARALGSAPRRLRVVACEPETFGGEEGRLGLSAPVAAAVEEAVRLVDSVLDGLSREAESCTKRA